MWCTDRLASKTHIHIKVFKKNEKIEEKDVGARHSTLQHPPRELLWHGSGEETQSGKLTKGFASGAGD